MVKQFCVLVVLASGSGCGGGDGGGGVGVVGVGSGAPQPSGDWVFSSPDGTAGAALDLGPGDTYTVLIGTITSSGQNSATANAQVETGTFAVTGNQITFTPKQSTCPGPAPVRVDTYSFSGQNLVLAGPAGIVSFAPNNSSSTATVGLTFGCFSDAGVFMASPLAPVSN